MLLLLSSHLSLGLLQILIYEYMNMFSHCRKGLMWNLNLNKNVATLLCTVYRTSPLDLLSPQSVVLKYISF